MPLQPAQNGSLVIKRPPQTRRELWHWFRAVMGVTIPRHRVCADHVAPFDVAWWVYTRACPVIVVKASRGLAGKSQLLGSMAAGLSILQGIEVIVLGGSMHQSLNVQAISADIWERPRMPTSLLAKEPTKTEYVLRNGGRVRAVPASQKSVRGPHPGALFMDEIDEMELPILDAAMGMPMPQKGMPAVTILSSTHQYPFGTMSEILNRANDMANWRSVKWCYRETSHKPWGWLDPVVVEQKRQELPPLMFDVEVELQDPALDASLFHMDHVAAMWDPQAGSFDGKPGEEVVVAEPEPGVRYATGVDWAKHKDWTVITTRRTDTWELVAWQRLNRLPWPDMVRTALDRLYRYPGAMAHDSTGIGDVIGDLFPEEARRHRAIYDVAMRGQDRAELFTEYMTALESSAFHGPRIEFAYKEHLYCEYKDLFTSAGHPPDSVVAEAMAWHCRGRTRPVPAGVKPVVGARTATPWSSLSTSTAGISAGSPGWSNWDR